MQKRHADVELPAELVLSIQRVLELNPEQNDDLLDDLSSNFNPMDILNQLFPDGVYFCTFHVSFVILVVTEASLSRLDAVQAKLAQDERDLQAEIDALQEALRRDQDPGRMQLIQEMISVWIFFPLNTHWSLKPPYRTSSGKCRGYARKRPNQRQ